MPHMLVLLAVPLLVGAYLYNAARRKRFQYAQFPQPDKPSFIWGHIPAIRSAFQRNKEAMHFDAVVHQMFKNMGNPSVMLLDTRPVGYPMVVIGNHETAEQISKPNKMFPWSTPKSPTVRELSSLLGATSMVTREGEDWKEIRKRFNPGFAPQHLMTLLPCILDKTAIFVERLDDWAKTDQEFPLTKAFIELTFDIIGAVVMDVDFDAQHHQSSTRTGQFIRLYDSLTRTYKRRDAGRPWWLFPRRILKRYLLGRQIDALLADLIREKFDEQQHETQAIANGNNKQAARSVLSLSLQGHTVLTNTLLTETMDSIKTFLFAGHDTTSIVLSWAFYYLSIHPSCQQALFDELNGLFGPDTDPESIRQKLLSPGGHELINRMPYTTAVIKETLRLRPPAGSARMAPPGSGCVVRTSEGQDLCLDGMVVYLCATVIQRDKSVYGDTADEFVPERWLNDKSGIMSETSNDKEDASGRKYPAGAWRPFERGPRNCIGQDLATIESRVILAVVARKYEFVKVGLGELERDEKGKFAWEEEGRKYKVKEELYNTTQITAKPIDWMKMKVRVRS
ncbi:putative sterigmatocystin biosynthesis P450 monooxygenase stcS [Cladorrhinum sp. PSN259]|nr:putative sterigmatocystin biosynthesis P450 monooxygenase stcS [Cladorrhinum sp. PSN259]